MRRIALSILVSLLAGSIWVGSIQLVYADEYIKLPLLVGLEGFSDADERESIEQRFRETVRDANRILEQCSTNHDTAKLKLGDLDSNLIFESHPDADSTPRPGTEDKATKQWKDLVNQAEEALSQRFPPTEGQPPTIGQYVYVVEGFDEEGAKDVAKGELGRPVAWITNDALLIARANDHFEGISGPYLVHEILHNTGIKEHTTEPGNVLNRPTELSGDRENPSDRGLTGDQCRALEKYFREHGLAQPNDSQKGAFVPQPSTSHYALVVNPASEAPEPTDLAMIRLSITDMEMNVLQGEIHWDGLLPRDTSVNLEMRVKGNFDGDPNTGYTSDQFVGYDGFAQLEIIGEGDGTFLLDSSFWVLNPDGTVKYRIPMDGELGTSISLGQVGAELEVSDFVLFQIDITGFFVLAEDIPSWVSVFDNVGGQNIYSFGLNDVPPPPEILNLPASTFPGATVEILGENFSPNSPISIILIDTPVASLLADQFGAFSGSFTVPTDMEKGDYFVEAVDEEGKFAFGILSVGKPCPVLEGFLEIENAFYHTEEVSLDAYATDGGEPLEGATVRIVVTDNTGYRRVDKVEITNENGHVTTDSDSGHFGFSIKQNWPEGDYTVEATFTFVCDPEPVTVVQMYQFQVRVFRPADAFTALSDALGVAIDLLEGIQGVINENLALGGGGFHDHFHDMFGPPTNDYTFLFDVPAQIGAVRQALDDLNNRVTALASFTADALEETLSSMTVGLESTGGTIAAEIESSTEAVRASIADSEATLMNTVDSSRDLSDAMLGSIEGQSGFLLATVVLIAITLLLAAVPVVRLLRQRS